MKVGKTIGFKWNRKELELLPLTGGKKIGRFNESVKFDYMSRKGNCWDNAVAESFFKTMKTEMVYHQKFANRKEAKLAIFEYIEGWYNRKRRPSALGYHTPCHLESLYLEKK